MKHFFYFIFAIGLFSAVSGHAEFLKHAQADSTSSFSIDSASVDSTEDSWTFDFDLWSHKTFSWHDNSPSIELNLGISNPLYKHDDFAEKKVEHNNLDLKLGLINTNNYLDEPALLEYSFSYLNLRNINRDFIKNYENIGMNTNTWSIGWNYTKGYGYKLWEGGALVLYHGGGFNWNLMEISGLTGSTDSLKTALSKASVKLFDDHVRFGETWESGLKLYITKGIALNASYQESIIFPRHLVFYNIVSSSIEGLAQSLLNSFLSHAGRESRSIIPVASFVLKSALTYGIYELRKDNMNWPIKTAAPFMYETYKAGLTFSL